MDTITDTNIRAKRIQERKRLRYYLRRKAQAVTSDCELNWLVINQIRGSLDSMGEGVGQGGAFDFD